MEKIWEDSIDGLKISVKKQRKGRFAVQYGLSLTADLDYSAAAQEIGSCILHALGCAGKLDSGVRYVADNK